MGPLAGESPGQTGTLVGVGRAARLLVGTPRRVHAAGSGSFHDLAVEGGRGGQPEISGTRDPCPRCDLLLASSHMIGQDAADLHTWDASLA